MTGHRLQVIAIILLTFAGLASCERTFLIRPEGRLDEHISFEFFEDANESTPARLNIVEFVVQKQTEGAEWETIWWLSGERSLNAITYGQSYDGLAERVPAQPLDKSGAYRVSASESSWPNPYGISGVSFSIDENGNVLRAHVGQD